MMGEDTNVYLLGFRKKMSRRTYIILGIIVLLVSFAVGVLVGYLGNLGRSSTSSGQPCKVESLGSEAEEQLARRIHDGIRTDRLRSNLRFLTERPHNAGTQGDERLSQWIFDKWQQFGMSAVKRYWYNVLLSFPDSASPNSVSVLDAAGSTRFRSQTLEKTLTPDTSSSDMVPPFNAYSPSGDVQGDLVYVNYGRAEDFKLIRDTYKINLTGKLVIARYGKIFRGNKVQLATDYGAAGVILYSDPADSAPFPSEPVYPHSWWFPPTGVQRGSLLLSSGDPQTPSYPSIKSAYRVPEDQIILPKIPCHPLGYGDAAYILSRMTGPTAPEEWRGSIPGVNYRLGPGLNETGWQVDLHVSTKNRVVNTSNVIGFIEGSEEPDRYVLIGNHRDAWGFGAIDPSSGTTVLMELAYVFSNLVKEGWRPRRSLVFCSWGAEEYGLIGSYEWVENFLPLLQQRAVAYINVDVAVLGNHSLDVGGLPLLHDLIREAAQKACNDVKVETANEKGKSLYDEWLENEPGQGTQPSVPHIKPLGSGSDFAAFVTYAGIPSVDLSYWYDKKAIPISYYPLYHSVYETFFAYETYVDPEFKYVQSVARFTGEMMRNLANSVLLPLNADTYGKELVASVEAFETKYGSVLQKHNISLDLLKEAAFQFRDTCQFFHGKRGNIPVTDGQAVRSYNDQLLQLERAFIDPLGLPGRPQDRHVLFAPSSKDAYSGSTFPGIVDILFDIEEHSDPDGQREVIKKHMASIIYTISTATSILSAPTEF